MGKLRFWQREPVLYDDERCACGHVTSTVGTGETTATERHRIGEVWIAGARLDKFCDGTEQ